MSAESDVPGTKPELRLDAVGIFWIIFAVVWTVILLSGIVFLYIWRNMPILRIRGLSLSFAAVAMLHCFWFTVTTDYVWDIIMPETAEYWIMSIWLPFGIGLFHAANSRFLHVANSQKRYIKKTGDIGRDNQHPRIQNRLVARWKLLSHGYRMLILVGLGMVFQLTAYTQLFTTVFVFVISRKFHSSFGVGDEVTGTLSEQDEQQSQGWEWWPSISWQVFWTWIVAPMILWRAHSLKDTHGWRTQTIACCISGLHAAPMWIIAVHVPAMAPINEYFVPRQWICVSIMMIEIFTILLPCWEVHKQQKLCQSTLDRIAQWESRQNSATPGNKSSESGFVATSCISPAGSRLLTMDALEHTVTVQEHEQGRVRLG